MDGHLCSSGLTFFPDPVARLSEFHQVLAPASGLRIGESRPMELARPLDNGRMAASAKAGVLTSRIGQITVYHWARSNRIDFARDKSAWCLGMVTLFRASGAPLHWKKDMRKLTTELGSAIPRTAVRRLPCRLQ
jgi:hypothetical protein